MAQEPGAPGGMSTGMSPKTRRTIIIGVGGVLVAACVGFAAKILMEEEAQPPKPVALAPKPAAPAATPAAAVAKPAAEAPKPAAAVVAATPPAPAPAPKPVAEAPKPAPAAPKTASAPVQVAEAKAPPPEPMPVRTAAPAEEEAPKAEPKPKPRAQPVAMPQFTGPTVPGPRYNDVMTAVMYKDTKGVEELIAMGKWIDKPDSQGRTPLQTAVSLEDMVTAEVLLKAGADVDRGMTAAREYRNQSMQALMKRYGAR